MRTEVRFLLAIVLMIGVLVGTNLLFPPVPPPEVAPGEDTSAVEVAEPEPVPSPATEVTPAVPDIPSSETTEPEPQAVTGDAVERLVTVESPLYRYTFNSVGARAESIALVSFESFAHDGPVELVPDGVDGILGTSLVVGSDTLDLSRVPFTVTPEDGLVLADGSGARTLSFVYEHPTQPFRLAVEYRFSPDTYVVGVSGQVSGVDRAAILTDLGPGLAFNEVRDADEVRSAAYVTNHLQDGITSRPMTSVDEPEFRDGPFLWVALRSKFFVSVILPGETDDSGRHLGAVAALPLVGAEGATVSVGQPLDAGNAFAYRLFAGPQQYATLQSVGSDLEEVNPYGWRFFRPIIRPFVSIILTALNFLHDTLSLGYGWVLIVFGVLMRVLLFPLNQKAMRAQLRNMAVQPLLKEIQTKYKDQPEKLQKEMMKLYKEHGFNPLAGCLPMLLPWPVLIALFFVFQNTIELRGVSFLWLPDLSAPDPLYVLPVFLGLSMFLLQFVSLRSIEAPNPQMKMMMWFMPVFMVFIFFNLASGLNLYYATANIATLPQQYWIAKERKKAQARGPLKASTSG